MTTIAPATEAFQPIAPPTRPYCVHQQLKLGITNPLPMWGLHWIENGRHLVRVYDSQTQATSKQYEALLRDPQRFANSWLEPE